VLGSVAACGPHSTGLFWQNMTYAAGASTMPAFQPPPD
jgi:hypothetical protein